MNITHVALNSPHTRERPPRCVVCWDHLRVCLDTEGILSDQGRARDQKNLVRNVYGYWPFVKPVRAESRSGKLGEDPAPRVAQSIADPGPKGNPPASGRMRTARRFPFRCFISFSGSVTAGYRGLSRRRGRWSEELACSRGTNYFPCSR